jgi:hypothetical protein
LLSALGLSLCLAAALGLPSLASADWRDGRGSRNERHGDRDGRGDRNGHGDRGRHGDSRWNHGRGYDHDGRGHGYAWGHDRRGHGYRYAEHRHGRGCGHGGYGHGDRNGHRYGNGYRPAYYGYRQTYPFRYFGR